MAVSEENTRTNITIPKVLKARLEEVARDKNRSFNNLVITVLMDYLNGLK